jgi:hypothetical protein
MTVLHRFPIGDSVSAEYAYLVNDAGRILPMDGAMRLWLRLCVVAPASYEGMVAIAAQRDSVVAVAMTFGSRTVESDPTRILDFGVYVQPDHRHGGLGGRLSLMIARGVLMSQPGVRLRTYTHPTNLDFFGKMRTRHPEWAAVSLDGRIEKWVGLSLAIEAVRSFDEPGAERLAVQRNEVWRSLDPEQRQQAERMLAEAAIGVDAVAPKA